MNKYYFSKKHKLFTLIHKEKKYFPFSEETYVENISEELPGNFSAERIKHEFVNSFQMLFEVTNVCNLKCKYCGYGELYCNYGIRKPKNLSFIRAKNLIDYYIKLRDISSYNSFNQPFVLGFYGGEPLLNFSLMKKIIDYAEGKIPNLSYNMTTNGILLDKYMNYLKEKNFTLLISLDGDEKCNSYRVYSNQASSFNRVYQNAKELKEKYPEYFTEKVSFNSVLHNQNSVEEVYNFFKREFNKTPRISEVSSTGVAQDKKSDFSNTYRNLRQSYLAAESCSGIFDDLNYEMPNVKSLTKFLFKFSDNVYKNYTDFFKDQSHFRFMPTSTCAPFNRKIFLLVDGRILPCERIGQDFEYGNVSNKKVELDFAAIAKKQNDFYEKIKNSCYSCGSLDICQKCVLQIENIQIDPICEQYTANGNYFSNYVAKQISILEDKPYLYKYIWENIVED